MFAKIVEAVNNLRMARVEVGLILGWLGLLVVGFHGGYVGGHAVGIVVNRFHVDSHFVHTPTQKVDLLCRYNVQALLLENLRRIEDEIRTVQLVYSTKSRYPTYDEGVDNPEGVKRLQDLKERKDLYGKELERILVECDRALLKLPKKID